MADFQTRVGYQQWRGRNGLDQELFILGLRLHGAEFPAWQMDSVRRSQSPAGIRLFSSIWTDRKGNQGERIVIDIHECASRLAAHEQMLTMLSSELPVEDLVQSDAVGDVALTRQGYFLVFARANVAVTLFNAGTRNVGVIELAQALDAMLTSMQPDAAHTHGIDQRVDRVEVKAEPAARVALGRVSDIALSLPTDPWFKFFAPSGRMFAEMGALFWVPATDGDQSVVRVSVTKQA